MKLSPTWRMPSGNQRHRRLVGCYLLPLLNFWLSDPFFAACRYELNWITLLGNRWVIHYNLISIMSVNRYITISGFARPFVGIGVDFFEMFDFINGGLWGVKFKKGRVMNQNPCSSITGEVALSFEFSYFSFRTAHRLNGKVQSTGKNSIL